MAVPYYNVGTATLTQGSAAMTGQGTLWAGNIRPGDVVVSYSGQTAIVESVNSNTSITLTRAFRGTSQTAQAYEITFAPADASVAVDVAAVLNAIRSSALVGLGSVVPTARKLPYFDASAAAALTDLSDYGRPIIAASDRTAFRAAAGFNNAVGPASNDANTLRDRSDWYTSSSWVNTPSPHGLLSVDVSTANFCIQTFYPLTGAPFAAYHRQCNTGTWTDWVQASPIGGVNANGNYQRVGNIVRCWSPTMPAVTTNVANGSLFESAEQSWTFPVAYAFTPVVTGTCQRSTGGVAAPWMGGSRTTTTTSTAYYLLVSTGVTGQGQARLEAIGIAA